MKRLLVIGAGLIGTRHIRAIQEHPACTLAGVVDPVAHADLSPKEHFTTIEQVDCHVDAVIIATPTDLHADHARQAAERGWPMLIEKPVTAYPEEAEKLAQIVKQHHVPCLVGHHRRYHDSIQQLQQSIAHGQIGEIVASNMIWSVRKPESYFDTQWRKEDGSPVMINLIHDIDLLRFVLGDIVDVAGFASAQLRQSGRVESGAIALKFASGACGTIMFADSAASPWGFEAATGENPHIAATGQDMWWIVGTKGAISYPSLTLWSGARDWSEAVTPTRSIKSEETVPLVAQLEHFLEVIDGKTSPLITIEDAAESLRITRKVEDYLALGLETV